MATTDPITPDSRRFSIRQPRPLWIGVVTGLLVGTVGQALGEDGARPQVNHIRLLATLEGHEGQVREVAFSPDGKLLASCSDDHTVKLWDVASRKELGTLAGHTAEVYALCFSPDGKTLASAGNARDGFVRIWNLSNRRLNGEFKHRLGTAKQITYLPGGKKLLLADAMIVTVSDTDGGESEEITAHDSIAALVSSTAVSPNGKLLAVGGHAATVAIWDLETRQVRTQLEAIPEGVRNYNNLHAVVSLAFSRNGRALASSCGLKIDSTVMLWDVAGICTSFEGECVAIE